jgi:hypothetical protein
MVYFLMCFAVYDYKLIAVEVIFLGRPRSLGDKGICLQSAL